MGSTVVTGWKLVLGSARDQRVGVSVGKKNQLACSFKGQVPILRGPVLSFVGFLILDCVDKRNLCESSLDCLPRDHASVLRGHELVGTRASLCQERTFVGLEHSRSKTPG